MPDGNIILIGPGGAGKSTLAKLLGVTLNCPAFDLDHDRWDYYAEIGYDRELAQQIRQERGFPALAAHWQPFDVHTVERILQDHPSGCVIAFGAGQSVYDDPVFTERVRRALEPHRVVLLLPSLDIEESLRILDQRLRRIETELPDTFFEMIAGMNRYFLTHPSNARLATFTIYTQNQAPEQTRDAILAALKQKDQS